MDVLDPYYRDPESWLWCVHKTHPPDTAWDFHLDEDCEIYALVSGQLEYFIEKGVYTVAPGQLILINSREIHRHAQVPAGPYERLILQFSPAPVRLFNPPGQDLLSPFFARPDGEQNRIIPGTQDWQEILLLMRSLENPSTPADVFSSLQRYLRFLELLVKIRKLHGEGAATGNGAIPDSLLPVLRHIDGHLDEDLSLETLEKLFFINRFHLGRLFLRTTGMTLHRYILYKRVAHAKELLAGGANVRTASSESGFSDLSNFSRAFTRLAGIPPSRYRKDCTSRASAVRQGDDGT